MASTQKDRNVVISDDTVRTIDHGIASWKLRISEKEKDKEWYINIMRNIVPIFNSRVNGYKRMVDIYKLLNNNMEMLEEQINKICNPISEINISDEKEFIPAYNRLFSKVTYHLAQMIRYTSDMDVVGVGEEMDRIKKEELMDKAGEMIDEFVNSAINGEGQADLMGQMQDMTSGGATPKQKKLDPDTYKSSIEQFYADVLEYMENRFMINNLKRKSFRDVVYVDRCFIDIVEERGEPKPVVYNPIQVGFDKSPNIEEIEKGDYFWLKTPITLAQAYDELAEYLTEEELEEQIIGIGGGTSPSRMWDIKRGASPDLDYSNVEMQYNKDAEMEDRNRGYSTVDGSTYGQLYNRRIFKTYLQFKAYREVWYIRYMDKYGKWVREVVPLEYPVPKDATKVKFRDDDHRMRTRYEWQDDLGRPCSAQRVWMPRRYEMWRYHNDIYVNMREIPNQPLSVDDLNEFSLSCKGAIMTAVNAESISLIERALPSYVQYIYVKMLMNKELGKYEGFIKNIDVTQIPDDIHLDSDGEPITEDADKLAIWRWYRRKLGDSYFNPNQDTSGLPNYQKNVPVRPEVAGSMQEIAAMQQLLEVIDREMGLNMLVPPQSEAIVDRYSNVTDNQEAIHSGYLMSEDYYMRHAEVWKNVYSEYLNRFRLYWQRWFENHPEKTEGRLQFQNSEGVTKTLKITPDMLKHEDMMIFLRHGHYGYTYRKMMEQQVQAIAQNRGEGVEAISEIIMALARGESPVKFNERINQIAKKQQERQDKIRKEEQEARRKEKQDLLEANKQIHQMKLDEIREKSKGENERKAMDVYMDEVELETKVDENAQDREHEKDLKRMDLNK